MMRVLSPALVLLVGCWPAWAQSSPRTAAKTRPSHAAGPASSARAKPAASSANSKPAQTISPPSSPARTVYAAMTEAERLTIQTDLIWTGDYNGVAAAEFGDRAIAAVKSFQKRNGGKETGFLNPDQRGRLSQSAKARQEFVGWRLVDDAATGVRLGIPAKLAPQTEPGPGGTRWQSPHGELQIETFRIAEPGTTLASIYEQQRRQPAERKPEYSVSRPDFFVVSGLQGLKKFYVRGEAKGNDVRGFTILYDQAMEGIVDPVAVAMSSAFQAFPSQPAAVAARPPRPRVEYGTGLVVSASGDIVTEADLLAGCASIVIPGLGHAEAVAQDREAAVALLRINGGHGLAVAALADTASARPGPAGDVTLVGIADPQAQAGGNAVSTLRGHVDAANRNAIDPTPGPGFAGAVAVGPDGSVDGIVTLRPPAAIVPAATIARFLGDQGIAVASGRAGIDGVEAAAVRVICVRP